MELKDVLITRDEWQDAFDKHYLGKTGCEKIYSAEQAQKKAQCLKLLKVLEDERLLKHDELEGATSFIHDPRCEICRLKKQLREDKNG